MKSERLMILTGKDKYQTGRYIMNDLKKVEEHFHEFLKAALREKPSRIDAIKLTEELFEQEEAFLIPFGFVSYFLGIEDGKPVAYVGMSTRMGIDFICFVDEDGYDVHDAIDGCDPEASRRYGEHSKNVKRFKEVKDLRKFEKQK